MYKLLLCWRYLLTRYLALVCIISVMLGVATLIVVNSVMAGFSTKLRDRLHGLLSDVVVESRDPGGFDDYEGLMKEIHTDPYLDSQIEAMTPTLEIFAMLQFNFRGQPFMRPVHLIGIDPEGRAEVGGFGLNTFSSPRTRTRASGRSSWSKEGFGRYLQRHPWHGIAMVQAEQAASKILHCPARSPNPPRPSGPRRT